MNLELLRALEQEAHNPITAGLSGEESTQVEQLFTSVLRSLIEVIFLTPVQHKNAIAQRTGEDLIRRVASISPYDRVGYLIKEKIDQDIRRIDFAAFALAKRLLMNPNQRESLIPQAKKILSASDRCKEEIMNTWPQQNERYGRLFSEISLDCQYVLGGTDKTSLRLGRLLKTRKIH
jgi:hypothetical protein